MSGDVVVRTASGSDLVAVAAAYEWLFDPPGQRPPDWDPTVAIRRLHEVVESARSTVFVAETTETTQLAGFCTVYLDIMSVRFGQRSWMEDLAVHPDHRSRNIGRRLLVTAAEWARQGGATHLELDSSDRRARAHAFYRTHQPGREAHCFGWDLARTLHPTPNDVGGGRHP